MISWSRRREGERTGGPRSKTFRTHDATKEKKSELFKRLIASRVPSLRGVSPETAAFLLHHFDIPSTTNLPYLSFPSLLSPLMPPPFFRPLFRVSSPSVFLFSISSTPLLFLYTHVPSFRVLSGLSYISSPPSLQSLSSFIMMISTPVASASRTPTMTVMMIY